MKKELNKIKKFSKDIIGKQNYKKIKKIKNQEDRTESLKYLSASKLELKMLELEQKIKKVGKEKQKLLELKLILLPSKIKIFKSTFNKKDYLTIKKLINEIEGELKNV